jgi:hypothetical protein
MGCASFNDNRVEVMRYENLYIHDFADNLIIRDTVWLGDSVRSSGNLYWVSYKEERTRNYARPYAYTEETTTGFDSVKYQVFSGSDTLQLLFERSFPAKLFSTKNHMLIITRSGIKYKRKRFREGRGLRVRGSDRN